MEAVAAYLASDFLGTHIGGHDNDRVFEIDRATNIVGQSAFLHDLKQHVPNFWMGFFNFVEQNHAVRFASHLFGELATFFVAHIARRRTNQPADIMLLRIF